MRVPQFDGLIRTMTVSYYASLTPAYPEYLDGFGGFGILLARLHPRCNKHIVNYETGFSINIDEENGVLARALVYMPDEEHEPEHLRRITIRMKNTEPNYESLKDYEDDDSQYMQKLEYERAERYRLTLDAIKMLPVLDLHELPGTGNGRRWPV